MEEYQVELQGLVPPPFPEDTDVEMVERERAERKRDEIERAGLAMGVVGDGESPLSLLHSCITSSPSPTFDSSFALLLSALLGSLTDMVVAGNAALKDGVIRIVRTFGGRLNAFKFPMGTARKLQGFVDYCG